MTNSGLLILDSKSQIQVPECYMAQKRTVNIKWTTRIHVQADKQSCEMSFMVKSCVGLYRYQPSATMRMLY